MAAQLENAGVKTVQDFVKVTDLATLNTRSGIPLGRLEQWHNFARARMLAYHRRLRIIAVLGLIILLGTISFWAYRRELGPGLDHQDGLDAAIAEYRKALAINPDYANARKNLDEV